MKICSAVDLTFWFKFFLRKKLYMAHNLTSIPPTLSVNPNANNQVEAFATEITIIYSQYTKLCNLILECKTQVLMSIDSSVSS